jgi:high affinity sulfate transporter 1
MPRAAWVSKILPVADWLPRYWKEWLAEDALAGLTAASVVIPQAMAYAAIASLPLAVGLYTTIIPLLVYALSGSSRVLSVTTTSTLAMLTGNALQQLDGDSAAFSISAAATLAFLVGAILSAAWALRLGWISSLISQPVLVGFKAGVGLLIMIGQIPHLLGMHLPKAGLLQTLASLFGHFSESSVPTLFFSLTSLVVLIILRRWFPGLPSSLLIILLAMAASAVFGFHKWGIQAVGEVQKGLPSFSEPAWHLCHELWPSAAGIALMSFVETIAAGQTFRARHEPRLRANQELLALGLSNMVGGLFQNMPSGGGTSQTAVTRDAGARTQAAGFVAAAMAILALLFLVPFLRFLPEAALAAVITVSCAAMLQLRDFRQILGIRNMEFRWSIAALIAVLALGTLKGILAAVVLSLFGLIYHANQRPVSVLGRKPGTDVFRPRCSEHPEDETFPGLLLVKTEGMVHFANAQRIGNLVTGLINEQHPRVVVLDCSAIPDFEYTALMMLSEAESKLRESGTLLWLASLNPEPLELVNRSPLGKVLGRNRMFFNVAQAVGAYQETMGS